MKKGFTPFRNTGNRRFKKEFLTGFTLLEAVISMAIIAVSVASSLVIMGKLASMTATKGDIMGLLTASAVAQYTVDEVRDINFPPIKTMEKDFDETQTHYKDVAYPPNSEYTSTTTLTFPSPQVNPYDTVNKSDNGTVNLIKTAVTVYRNGKPLMTTYTYKVRNGQF